MKTPEDGNKSTGDISREQEQQRWKTEEDLKPDISIGDAVMSLKGKY